MINSKIWAGFDMGKDSPRSEKTKEKHCPLIQFDIFIPMVVPEATGLHKNLKE